MSVTELFTRIQEAGVTLVLEDGRLRYRPKDRMTPDLAADIGEHREAIIEVLAGKGPAQKRENVKTHPCSECGRRLCLPESQAIGRCIRCQSEAEFVDTLARINIRRARTARAVAARVKELEAVL